MKNIFLRLTGKQNWLLWIAGFGIAAFALVACIDDPVEPIPVGYVSLYNAAAYEPSSVDIYMNGTKLNSQTFNYSKFSGYLNFTEGNSKLEFTQVGTITKLAENSFAVVGGKAYSVFVINQGTTFETLLVNDNSKLVGIDSSRVRFVNLSPDSPEIDLVVTGTSTRLFESSTYKTASEYKSIKANTYSIDVVKKSDGTVLTTVPNIILGTSKYYSIIAQGFSSTRPEGNNNSLTLKLVNN